MWRQFASDGLSAATATVAILGAVLAVGGCAWVYASGCGIPLSRRLMGFVATTAWSAAPFLVILGMTSWLVGSKAASAVLLLGASVALAATAYAASIVFDAIRQSSHDGQTGFAVFLIQAVQLVAAGVAALVASLVAWLFRGSS